MKAVDAHAITHQKRLYLCDLFVLRPETAQNLLTLYQPMTHICVMNSHKNLYGGFNTLYRLFCFFKLFSMVRKGLKPGSKLKFLLHI